MLKEMGCAVDWGRVQVLGWVSLVGFHFLQEQFEKAAQEASTVLPSSITNKEKVTLYGLFKQAKVGDVNIGNNITPCPPSLIVLSFDLNV